MSVVKILAFLELEQKLAFFKDLFKFYVLFLKRCHMTNPLKVV